MLATGEGADGGLPVALAAGVAVLTGRVREVCASGLGAAAALVVAAGLCRLGCGVAAAGVGAAGVGAAFAVAGVTAAAAEEVGLANRTT